MEFNGYWHEPKALIELTTDDINILLECSRNHYDGTCKAASERGGFLYGWNNQIIFSEELRSKDEQDGAVKPLCYYRSELVVKPREIDLCLKILELSYVYFRDNEKLSEQAFSLSIQLKKVFVGFDAESKRVNGPTIDARYEKTTTFEHTS